MQFFKGAIAANYARFENTPNRKWDADQNELKRVYLAHANLLTQPSIFSHFPPSAKTNIQPIPAGCKLCSKVTHGPRIAAARGANVCFRFDLVELRRCCTFRRRLTAAIIIIKKNSSLQNRYLGVYGFDSRQGPRCSIICPRSPQDENYIFHYSRLDF